MIVSNILNLKTMLLTTEPQSEQNSTLKSNDKENNSLLASTKDICVIKGHVGSSRNLFLIEELHRYCH